jgi:hypothetical protein
MGLSKMTRTDHDVHELISGSPEQEDFDTLAQLALRQRGFQWSNEGVVRAEVHDRTISLLHDVAKEVMLPGEPPFFVERTKRGSWVRSSLLGGRLVQVLSADFDQIQADYPLHQFSPVFMVFLRFRRHLPLNPSSYFNRHTPPELAEQILAAALRLVRLLRRKLGREALKTANENFRRGAMDNFNGLIDAIEWLSQRRTSVTSLRFDLHYSKIGSHPVRFGDEPDVHVLDELMDYRERFHRSLDRRFGDALWGYAWVLEYGRERTFHLHYLVMLDPRGHEDHRGLVDMLGEKWRVLTEGRGEIFNCHIRKRQYKYTAIGHVRLDDPSAVKGLHFIVSYMTLAALFVKLDIQKRFRTFAKGRFPKAAGAKVGRPQHRPPGSRIKISVAEARASYLNFL